MAMMVRKRSQGRLPAQPVIGKSLANGEEFYFSSICEAKEQGFHAQTISLCLRGKLKQTGGFKWRRWE